MKRPLPRGLAALLVFGLAALAQLASCDASTPGRNVSAESSAFAVSICGYLARCMPAALNAFSEGKVSSCEASFTCGRGGLAALAGGQPLDEVACAAEIDRAACGELSLGYTGHAPRLIASAGSACAEAPLVSRGPHARPGERCTSEEGSCAEGLYCKLDEPLKSVAGKLCGVCTAEAEPGEPCPPGTPCSGDAFCELGECVPRQPVGSDCTDASQCLEGACVAGSCAPNPYLHLVADGSAEGDVCELTEPFPCRGDVTLACLDVLLARGTARFDGRCARRPDRGEPCQDLTSCRTGLLCQDGHCRVPYRCTSQVGARCGPEAGYVCSGDTLCTGKNASEMRCTPRIVGHHEGDACNISCDADGLSCMDGSCVRDGEPAYGGRCDSSFDCERAACDRDIAPYCSLTDSRFFCSVPPCDGCGTCVPKPTPEACDDATVGQ